MCGYGIVLAMLLAAAVTALTARADTAQAWVQPAPWLAAFAVAAGAWMYMHAPDKERVEQTIVAPVIDRGHVGLAVQGAF